jgi:hypothetical protein
MKRNIFLIILVLLVFPLAAVSAGGNAEGEKGADDMEDMSDGKTLSAAENSSVAAPAGAVPLIDRNVPEVLKSATFALG